MTRRPFGEALAVSICPAGRWLHAGLIAGHVRPRQTLPPLGAAYTACWRWPTHLCSSRCLGLWLVTKSYATASAAKVTP